ncbi:hypothetical protein GCM10027294_52000 [Marinactinospora endophytica]
MNTASELRNALVDQIRDGGWITTARVERAMRSVERHLFLPEADLEEAYADKNVPTKTAPDGTCLSSVSTPGIVAMMLEQLHVRPGQRILEIGAGTGYNAALLTHLGAEVTTIDIDPDAVAHTRKALERAGIRGVHLVEGDGENGVPRRVPYDRIIVTAGAWDIPPAWFDQLVEGGLLVVPLRFRGTTRSFAFERRGDRLESKSVKLCGFIPMRNDDGEHDIDLGGVSLRCDDDQDITAEALGSVLDTPRSELWSEVEIGAEPLHGIWGRLAVFETGTCRIMATDEAVRSGRAVPVIPMLSPAIAEDASLAYLAHRPLPSREGGHRSRLGVIGHGPNGDELCARLLDHIREWGKDRSDRIGATVVKKTAATAGRGITKHDTVLCLDWKG